MSNLYRVMITARSAPYRPCFHPFRPGVSLRVGTLQLRRIRVHSLEEDSENVDIEKLAKQLSQAATYRRQEVSTMLPEDAFQIADFEIVQTLGYLSVKMQNGLNGNTICDKAALIAYVGRYFSGKTQRFPVLTLLKEFLPMARSIAENEFRIHRRLSQLPEDPWEAASSPEMDTLPVVRLLGCFRGSPVEGLPEKRLKSAKKSLWLVYKWDGLKPLSAYFATEQTPPGAIWPWARSKTREMKQRHRMIRAICKGLFEAVAYCHQKGVIHGSLGSGSVLLSTFDDFAADELVVKLDNFGFASERTSSGEDENPVDVRQDVQALGTLFLEIVILSLAECQRADSCDPFTIERLALEIFGDDFLSLQDYCRSEPDWQHAVALLDQHEKAGWNLLQHLLQGDLSAEDCVKHRFLS